MLGVGRVWWGVLPFLSSSGKAGPTKPGPSVKFITVHFVARFRFDFVCQERDENVPFAMLGSSSSSIYRPMPWRVQRVLFFWTKRTRRTGETINGFPLSFHQQIIDLSHYFLLLFSEATDFCVGAGFVLFSLLVPLFKSTLQRSPQAAGGTRC